MISYALSFCQHICICSIPKRGPLHTLVGNQSPPDAKDSPGRGSTTTSRPSGGIVKHSRSKNDLLRTSRRCKAAHSLAAPRLPVSIFCSNTNSQPSLGRPPWRAARCQHTLPCLDWNAFPQTPSPHAATTLYHAASTLLAKKQVSYRVFMVLVRRRNAPISVCESRCRPALRATSSGRRLGACATVSVEHFGGLYPKLHRWTSPDGAQAAAQEQTVPQRFYAR